MEDSLSLDAGPISMDTGLCPVNPHSWSAQTFAERQTANGPSVQLEASEALEVASGNEIDQRISDRPEEYNNSGDDGSRPASDTLDPISSDSISESSEALRISQFVIYSTYLQ